MSETPESYNGELPWQTTTVSLPGRIAAAYRERADMMFSGDVAAAITETLVRDVDAAAGADLLDRAAGMRGAGPAQRIDFEAGDGEWARLAESGKRRKGEEMQSEPSATQEPT